MFVIDQIVLKVCDAIKAHGHITVIASQSAMYFSLAITTDLFVRRCSLGCSVVFDPFHETKMRSRMRTTASITD
jgi:hypothetical protein